MPAGAACASVLGRAHSSGVLAPLPSKPHTAMLCVPPDVFLSLATHLQQQQQQQQSSGTSGSNMAAHATPDAPTAASAVAHGHSTAARRLGDSFTAASQQQQQQQQQFASFDRPHIGDGSGGDTGTATTAAVSSGAPHDGNGGESGVATAAAVLGACAALGCGIVDVMTVPELPDRLALPGLGWARRDGGVGASGSCRGCRAWPARTSRRVGSALFRRGGGSGRSRRSAPLHRVTASNGGDSRGPTGNRSVDTHQQHSRSRFPPPAWPSHVAHAPPPPPARRLAVGSSRCVVATQRSRGSIAWPGRAFGNPGSPAHIPACRWRWWTRGGSSN